MPRRAASAIGADQVGADRCTASQRSPNRARYFRTRSESLIDEVVRSVEPLALLDVLVLFMPSLRLRGPRLLERWRGEV